MTLIYSLLALFSAAGLFLSASCHLLSWLQIEPPGGKAVFLLHVGIFVVWVPLVACANHTMPRPGRGNFDHLLKQLPRWTQRCVSGLFVYTLVNFVTFIVLAGRYPKNGVPLYLEIRGFSGHWMLFYGVALAGFVGLRRLRQNAAGDALPRPAAHR